MDTFHIHIKGMVQGVGFRPFVHQLANDMILCGYVSNTKNGVHIEINTDENTAHIFCQKIVQHPPANALITGYTLSKTSLKSYSQFSITPDASDDIPNLFLTPDISICAQCQLDLADVKGKRYRYPFTTCLQCGPRYSILKALPYDRINTTMHYLSMCPACLHEYEDIGDRRYYSQTNSCPECAIQMHIYTNESTEIQLSQDAIITYLSTALLAGKIVAIKGTGGFLLLCDATNAQAIKGLRHKKHRPTKPLAVMYADLNQVEKDHIIHEHEKSILQSKAAPILLCKRKKICTTGLCSDEIAPGLDKTGVMLPNNPMLYLIAKACGIPLVTTSGNISGSPILYTDAEALKHLFEIADFILTHDRAITIPQDDSVMQRTETGQTIILRRSRGLAPGYFPHPFSTAPKPVIAFGGELKGAFAIHEKENLYVSQYLGDQQTLESQHAFKQSMFQLTQMLHIQAEVVLADSHPGYHTSFAAEYYGQVYGIKNILKIQHHRAHFGAVLAENNLLNKTEPILGIIWDGTGYGDDHQIWGSEVFLYENSEMRRVAHLTYFKHLMRDKMSREPRLSALSLLEGLPGYQPFIESTFTDTEWKYYHKVISQKAETMTSSMGRFLDGIASLLGIGSVQQYEGETVMKMEALARNYVPETEEYYHFEIADGQIHFEKFISEVAADYQREGNVPKISRKVFYSLAKLIEKLADHFSAKNIAFSGGVFQNALLTDMIKTLLGDKKHLYFHIQLSPNDECIGFGQIACYYIQQQKE